MKSNRNLCKFILPNFQTFRYSIPWLSLEHDLNLPEVTLLFCWLSWALFLSLEVGVERLLRELLRLELLWDPPSLQEGFVIVGHLLPLLNGDGNLQKDLDDKWPFKNNGGNQSPHSTTKNRSSWPQFPKRLERKFHLNVNYEKKIHCCNILHTKNIMNALINSQFIIFNFIIKIWPSSILLLHSNRVTTIKAK